MNPALTEPGVKYFLGQTLKKCKKKKNEFYCLLFNLFFFVAFLCLFGGILYYKYKGKPSKEDNERRKLELENYVVSKIKQHQKPTKNLITNLPKFENNTEIMHRNFFNN